MAGGTDVVVRFLADTSKIQGAVSEVEGTGNRLKTWAKGAAAAIGTAFAVDQLKQATDAAASFADAVSASDQIFASSARAVDKWVQSNAIAFNLSKQQAQDAANQFGIFGKAAGLSGKDLSGFSTNLVGLAGDLRSFYGGNVDQAITAIGAALRGESEPIRQYGVLLDDATLKARAMSMGLVQASTDADKIAAANLAAAKAQDVYNQAVAKYGPDSKQAQEAQVKLGLAHSRLADATEGTIGPLTQQQRVLAANAEIMAQTAVAQGDAGRTADSAANQQAKMAAQVKNTQLAIGTALLPAMQALLPIVTAIAAAFERYAPILVPLAAVILGIVAAMKLATIAQWAYNAAVGANPIGAIILGIMALIAIIVLIVKHWDDVKAAAQACWDAILSAVQFVWNWIKDNWPLILAVLTGPFGIAVLAIVHFKDDIWNAIKFVYDWIVDHWPLLAAILTGPFGIAVYLIASHWDTIKNGVSNALDSIVGFFGGLAGRILGAVGNIGAQIVDHMFGGLESAAERIVDKVANIGRRITSALNPFDSPHTHAYYVGRGAMRDLYAGARSLRVPTAAAFAAMGRPTVDAYAAGGARRAGTVINVNVTTTGLGADAPQIQRAVVAALRGYADKNGPIDGITR